MFSETADGFISASLDADNASAKNSKKLTTGLDSVSTVVGGILTCCGFLGNTCNLGSLKFMM